MINVIYGTIWRFVCPAMSHLRSTDEYRFLASCLCSLLIARRRKNGPSNEKPVMMDDDARARYTKLRYTNVYV